MAELGQEVREVRLIAAATPANWIAPAPAAEPVVQEEPAPDAPAAEPKSTKPPEGPADMNEFKNDPLIKKALEVFKGQIVDVRT